MSAWTVYWIMQADSICGAAVGLTMLFATVMTIALVIAFVESGSYSDREVVKRAFGIAKVSGAALLAVGLFATFMPDTKTLCAIIAVPMVVNNETLQADSTEIYKLGMERLKEVLTENRPATR